ncbi:hypothetical protein XH98_21790 [Bradyrhizobium sp. CCBAU 51745]|nr:hypothetical protein [Bradyrhizobium sp. CCBAU 45384]MDA9441668.1 hypothetical protein [Bradyrhizobium sp. CCBAU 51745]
MYFTLIKPEVATASMQSNLSLLEALAGVARTQFTTLLDQLADLQSQSVAASAIERDGHGGLIGARRDMIAIIKVMQRMADELLQESKQSWESVGYISGNVHKIAFGRRRLLGGRTPNDLHAAAVEEKLRRTPRLMISLLEVATILEEAFADLRPVKKERISGNSEGCSVDVAPVQ